MNWLILRTDFRKEAYVARQVEALGFSAWVPMEVRFQRIGGPVKTKRAHIWETPILATVLFAAVPRAFWGDVMNWRDFRDFHRDKATGEPYIVSQDQIDAFRDMVDRENTIRRRQFERKQEGKRAKRTLRLGDENALAIIFKELFGLEVEQRQAA